MTRTTTYIAWLALLLSMLAWAGVGWFVSAIVALQDGRAVNAQASQQLSGVVAQASQLHALIADTAADRASLASLITVDPSSLAGMIDGAGKSAGVGITISSALSENAPGESNGAPVQAFSFIATAAGSFSTVLRGGELLETLPVPSSIKELQLTRTPDTAGASSAAGPWQMNAQVQVLTASTISS